jgi:hypothetical protein
MAPLSLDSGSPGGLLRKASNVLVTRWSARDRLLVALRLQFVPRGRKFAPPDPPKINIEASERFRLAARNGWPAKQ